MPALCYSRLQKRFLDLLEEAKQHHHEYRNAQHAQNTQDLLGEYILLSQAGLCGEEDVPNPGKLKHACRDRLKELHARYAAGQHNILDTITEANSPPAVEQVSCHRYPKRNSRRPPQSLQKTHAGVRKISRRARTTTTTKMGCVSPTVVRSIEHDLLDSASAAPLPLPANAMNRGADPQANFLSGVEYAVEAFRVVYARLGERDFTGLVESLYGETQRAMRGWERKESRGKSFWEVV